MGTDSESGKIADIASNARVEWRDSREATVYLDDYPVLECIDGWWSKYDK